uniref:EFNB2 n=1 Tax=Panagrellus redivivus TaxID=6233 RepID=A0A7E4VID3_PANRE
MSDIDHNALFNVSFVTNAAINCIIPKYEVLFPRIRSITTTTASTSLSTTTPAYKERTGLSALSIIFIIIGCVVFVLIIAAIALGVFLCKRKKVLCFKKPPRPWYLPSPSQDVEGIPENYTCRAGQERRQRKRSESKDTVNTFDSVEQVPSKIKLYKDGEYANIIMDSTATAVSIQKTTQKSTIQP